MKTLENIRSVFSDDPEMLRIIEAREQTELLRKLLEKPTYTITNKAPVISLEGIPKIKGEDGHTPTTEELLNLIIPLIPSPIPGESGKTPTKGELQDIIRPLIPELPEVKLPTEDYFRSLIKSLIPSPIISLPSKQITPEEIVEYIKNLEGEEAVEFGKKMGAKIDISYVRNASSFMYKGTRYKIEELMHGAGTAGTSTNVVTQYDLQTKTQVGSNVVVPLSQLTNFATLTNVVAAYRNQIPQTNGVTMNVTATDITFLNADMGEVFSITYVYS